MKFVSISVAVLIALLAGACGEQVPAEDVIDSTLVVVDTAVVEVPVDTLAVEVIMDTTMVVDTTLIVPDSVVIVDTAGVVI
jgi:hypothetical protein